MTAKGSAANDLRVPGALPRILVLGRGRALDQSLVRLLQRSGFPARHARLDQAASALGFAPAVALLDADAEPEVLTACVRALDDSPVPVRVLLLAHEEVDRCGALAEELGAAGWTTTRVEPAWLCRLLTHADAADGTGRGPRPEAERRGAPHGERPAGALAHLTPRELEVLRLLVAGARSTGIARNLGISPHTVRSHLQNIFAKLGTRSRLEAVSIGLREGLRPELDACRDQGPAA